MHPIVNIGVKAARTAGDMIARAVERLDTIKVTEKSKNNFVTNVDKKAEDIIIDIIKQAHPDHAIVAEESGTVGSAEHDVCWIIDPLDGTSNFMHGFPHFAVSIGVTVRGQLEHGVIFDPIRQELFTASRGKGAKINDRRMRVAKEPRMDKCLLGTGFPFRNNDPNIDFYLQSFTTLYPKSSGIRRTGSAALDLAYVAAGRLDGYWELGLSPWDMAAGALMIREAGGMVSDFQGEDKFLENGRIVAGNVKIYTAILATLQALDKEKANSK